MVELIKYVANLKIINFAICRVFPDTVTYYPMIVTSNVLSLVKNFIKVP